MFICSLSEVDESEDVSSNGDGGDRQVGEKEGDEVEGQVVLDCSSIWVVSGFTLGEGGVVVDESKKVLSWVSKSESWDPGTDSDDASESEVFISLNDGNSLAKSLHLLISDPEESSLNVSNDGDGEGPGEEENDWEELPESEEISSVRSTSVNVVESLKEFNWGLNTLDTSISGGELRCNKGDKITGICEELWGPHGHGWVHSWWGTLEDNSGDSETDNRS